MKYSNIRRRYGRAKKMKRHYKKRHYRKKYRKRGKAYRKQYAGNRVQSNELMCYNNKVSKYVKPYIRLIPMDRYQTNGAIQVNQSHTGYQSAISVPLGGKTDLLYFYSQIGSAVAPHAAKLFVRSSMLEMSICNNESVQCEITIYLCKPRRDLAATYEPVELWSTATDSGAPSSPQNKYGATPFMSAAFCNGWKVVKSRKVFLCAGGIEKVTIKNNINRIFNTSNYQTDIEYLRGFTVVPIVVVRGTPVNDQLSGAIPLPSKYKINVLNQYTYEACIPNNYGKQVVVVDTFGHGTDSTIKMNDLGTAIIDNSA